MFSKCVSDLSKCCVHLLEKEGLGPVRDAFPISNYVVYRAVMAVRVGILYNSGDFAILYYWYNSGDFAILYYWKLMYVLDYVCFIPSKSQTIMPKSLTCGYSISVPDTSVVGYTTLHLHITDQWIQCSRI